jgi:hypothetical protein
MPQATHAQRALMGKWFGDEVDDGGPHAFLLSRGYTEAGGCIRPPTPSHQISREECECIAFLINEWDYAYGVTP